jgi:hypothetical protein
MNEPLDLAPELAHKKRVEELQMMAKKGNRFFPSSKEEVKDILETLNLRLKQYPARGYSFEFRILQSVQDFQNIIKPLQVFKPRQRMTERLGKAKVDFKSAVAQQGNKMIYAKDEDGFDVFSFEKPKE